MKFKKCNSWNKHVATLILSLCTRVLQSSLKIKCPFTNIVTRHFDYSLQCRRLPTDVLYFLSMLSNPAFAPFDLLIWLNTVLIPWLTECSHISGHHQFGFTFFCIYYSYDFRTVCWNNKHLYYNKYVCRIQLLRWGRSQGYLNEWVQKD